MIPQIRSATGRMRSSPGFSGSLRLAAARIFHLPEAVIVKAEDIDESPDCRHIRGA